MEYPRCLAVGSMICLVILLSMVVPAAQSQRPTQPSTLQRVMSIEPNLNYSGAIVTYTDYYSLSKLLSMERLEPSVLYIKLPDPYASQVLQYPSSFEFIQLPKGQQNPFNITRESDGIRIAALKDSLALGVEGSYVNFTIRYRIFVQSTIISSTTKNYTVPVSFENNLLIDSFSINLTIPAYMLGGTANASWNFFERLDTANYTLLWQKPSIHDPSKFVVTSLELETKTTKIIVRYVKKTVKFDPFGGLSVDEGYSIGTDPYSAVTDLPSVLLPNGAFDVGSKDYVGELEDTGTVQVANTSRYYAKVTPRIVLYYGANYTFFVTYKLPLPNYTTRVYDTVTIMVPLASNYTDFVESYSLDVQLPIGAKLTSIEFVNTKLTNITQQGDTYSVQLKYIPKDMIGRDLKVIFSYSPLWAGYMPSMVLFASGVVILGVYYVRTKRGGPLGPEVVETKMALASDLAHVLRKQLALQSQIQELELRYFEGQISRREFRNIYQNLKSELDKRGTEVATMSKKLREASPQYENKIKTLEGLQIELKARHASLREIGFNYLNRKLSHSTYSELSSRYSGEISSVVSRIRAILEGL